jgi:integrase
LYDRPSGEGQGGGAETRVTAFCARSTSVGVVYGGHNLRHTASTHLVQAGVDLPTVKRISGHKTLIMVERYAHQHGAHIEAARDKLEERPEIS